MSVVYLTSVVNFRDFGGHPTISGQNVARGRLYRSNQFSRLNADDAAKLAALGIAAVVDLRSAAERTAQPTAHSVGRGPDHVSARADTDFIFTDIFASTEPTEGAWLDAFKRFYIQLPELYADEYRGMMELLAKNDVPLIIHCSAGKDRTGVAVAVILDLIGVERAAIVADYRESDARLADDQHFRAMFSEAKLERYAELPEECRSIMLATQADFILAALDGLGQAYGSTRAYVRDRLGVSQSGIDRIKRNLLV